MSNEQFITRGYEIAAMPHGEDREGKLVIAVEKVLCDALGRDWSPSVSIVTLAAEIKSRPSPPPPSS